MKVSEEELAIIREEQSLSIETHEEFEKFTESNDVAYGYGEGYLIQALISTEEEFIDFVQKVGMITLWGDGLVPFIVNDSSVFNEYFEYKNTIRKSEMDTVETMQWGDDGPEILNETFYPTEEKEIFIASYNPYFDKPYRIRRQKVRVYGNQDIQVKESVKQKLPAVVTFVSHDTFDRCGSIEGHDLSIISLNKLTKKAVFA